MNVIEMVVIIVVIGCATGVITEYFKTKRKTGSMINDDLDDALDKIDDLEERVRVLEKVVTDDRYDLKRKFEDLEE